MIGRALARQMRPDTSDDVAFRMAHSAVIAQVQQELTNRPAVTLEECGAEFGWAQRRIVELMTERGWPLP